MQAPLNMGGYNVVNSRDPVYPADLMTLNYATNHYLNSGGGTVTGNVSFTGTTNASATFSKTASGYANTIYGDTNGTLRWLIALGDSTPESGSNNGSDLTISCYTDTGVYIAAPFQIKRSTGIVYIYDGINVAGGATVAGGLAVTGAANLAGASTATAPTVAAADNSTNIATTAFANNFLTYVFANGPSITSPTTNAPAAADNSARIPNTNWVWSNAGAVNAGVAFAAVGDVCVGVFTGVLNINAGATFAGNLFTIQGPGTGTSLTPGAGTVWRCQGSWNTGGASTWMIAKRIS